MVQSYFAPSTMFSIINMVDDILLFFYKLGLNFMIQLFEGLALSPAYLNTESFFVCFLFFCYHS